MAEPYDDLETRGGGRREALATVVVGRTLAQTSDWGLSKAFLKAVAE